MCRRHAGFNVSSTLYQKWISTLDLCSVLQHSRYVRYQCLEYLLIRDRRHHSKIIYLDAVTTADRKGHRRLEISKAAPNHQHPAKAIEACELCNPNIMSAQPNSGWVRFMFSACVWPMCCKKCRLLPSL